MARPTAQASRYEEPAGQTSTRRSSRNSASSNDNVPLKATTTRSGRAQVKPSYREDDDDEQEEEQDEEEALDDVEDEEEDAEGEDEAVAEEDAEGEEEDAEGEEEDVVYAQQNDHSRPAPEDNMEMDEDDIPLRPKDHSTFRIKLKVGSSSSNPASETTDLLPRLKRAPRISNSSSSKPKGGFKKSIAQMDADEEDEVFDEDLLMDDDPAEDALGEDEDEEEDMLEEEVGEDGGSSRRSQSPSKMTARQRARGNQDLQETLLALPMDPGNKKMVLTEAEKVQRREETARKRKRQMEAKVQGEMDSTINRLLRAQTTKSRAKLDNPSPALEDGTEPSSRSSPSGRSGPPGTTIRWVSSMKGDQVTLRVAAPKGQDDWIAVAEKASAKSTGSIRNVSGICGVKGCGEKRKYRSTKRFEVGGCSMEHLKSVEVGL